VAALPICNALRAAGIEVWFVRRGIAGIQLHGSAVGSERLRVGVERVANPEIVWSQTSPPRSSLWGRRSQANDVLGRSL
jgi:hypothetical protein